MRFVPFLLLFVAPAGSYSQLYLDASANLPDNGAKGQSMDVRAADLDGDGDLDIVLANEFQANTWLRNQGDETFSNASAGAMSSTVHDSEDVAIADFNDDGDLDLVFCSEDDVNLGTVNVHEYYLGNGAGAFVPATFLLPDSEANAVIATDLNGDDLPDLLFGNDGGTGVLINQSSAPGEFAVENNRVPQVDRTTQDLALADVDGDGDLDLFEGNEDGNLLHINDGMGQFANESFARLPQGLNIETRKAAFGDVDGDGDLDLFLANVLFIPGKNPQNRLFLNDGNGFFSDVTATQLPADSDHTIDAIFEDVDLDEDLDLVLGNVFGAPVKVYRNDGNGLFSDATLAILGQYYQRDALGLIAADLNGDGFRDLYICDRKTPPSNNKDLLLLRTTATATEEPEGSEPTALLYPNPVDDHFYLQTALPLPADSLSLLDLQGKVVAQVQAEPQGKGLYRFQVNRSKLRAGLYFLNLEGLVKRIFLAP